MNASISFWPDVVKGLLKLLVLAPVAFAFFCQLHSYRVPEPSLVPQVTFSSSGRESVHMVAESPKTPDQTTTILLTTFGVTALLGFASLLFQFVLRRCEHAITTIFFGVVALLMVVNAVSELLSSGLSADLRNDYAFMVGLFVVSIGGVWFESYRQKRVYESRIG